MLPGGDTAPGRVSGPGVGCRAVAGLLADQPRQGLPPSPARARAGVAAGRAASPGRRILRPADGNRAAPPAHVGRSQCSSATGSGAQRPVPPGHLSVHGSPGPTCAGGAASPWCRSIAEAEKNSARSVRCRLRFLVEAWSSKWGTERVFHMPGIRPIWECANRMNITASGITRPVPAPFM